MVAAQKRHHDERPTERCSERVLIATLSTRALQPNVNLLPKSPCAKLSVVRQLAFKAYPVDVPGARKIDRQLHAISHIQQPVTGCSDLDMGGLSCTRRYIFQNDNHRRKFGCHWRFAEPCSVRLHCSEHRQSQVNKIRRFAVLNEQFPVFRWWHHLMLSLIRTYLATGDAQRITKVHLIRHFV